MSWKDWFGWVALWSFLALPTTVALLAAMAVVQMTYPSVYLLTPWVQAAILMESGLWISSLFGLWAMNGFPPPP